VSLTLRRSALVSAFLLAGVACGSRSGLYLGAATRDAGVTPGAATRDAGITPRETDAASTKEVLLLGGYGYQSNVPTVFTDMWRWDGTWTQLPGAVPMNTPAWALLVQAGSGLLYYGGPLFSNGSVLAPDLTTWTWDGTTWTMFAGEQPSQRVSAAMASLAGTPVLFGGYDANNNQLSDTWTWGGAWSEASVTTNPGPRYGAAMASLGNTLVLFGGSNAPGEVTLNVPALADTWTWSGTTWTNLNVSGPTGRIGAAMASLGDSVLLYGGADGNGNLFADTWTFDGTSWKQENVSGPSAREAPAIAGVGGTAILFGGHVVAGSELADTWLWDGSTWTQLAVSGPGGRYAAAMSAY
jgi:hypothetical protein